MAYIPTSKNPHITTAMLQQALYMEYRSKKGIEILMQNEKKYYTKHKKAYHQNPLPFKDFMLH